MKGSNETEQEALKKMEAASEKIAQEFSSIREAMIRGRREGIPVGKAIEQFSPVEKNRLLKIIFRIGK